MQEYITGRVKLSECDSKKAITGKFASSQDLHVNQCVCRARRQLLTQCALFGCAPIDIKDPKAQLTFVLDDSENIVTDLVPSVYGVRCGAVVDGFLRPNSTKLHAVQWPSKSKKECTLAELMKANGISKKDDTLVFQTECLYKTQILKVDTKDFGLPQTRERTYMFVWRPDHDDIEDDLGDYWMEIVRHLQSPVRHSLQSFILQVDHDIIRVFREALRGPPGRQSMRGVSLEPYFWYVNLLSDLHLRRSDYDEICFLNPFYIFQPQGKLKRQSPSQQGRTREAWSGG